MVIWPLYLDRELYYPEAKYFTQNSLQNANFTYLDPKIFFQTLQFLLFSFIWKNKASRLKRDVLWHTKRKGGLAIPNIYRCYLAIHLSSFIDWCVYVQTKQWVEWRKRLWGFSLKDLPWFSFKLEGS